MIGEFLDQTRERTSFIVQGKLTQNPLALFCQPMLDRRRQGSDESVRGLGVQKLCQWAFRADVTGKRVGEDRVITSDLSLEELFELAVAFHETLDAFLQAPTPRVEIVGEDRCQL